MLEGKLHGLEIYGHEEMTYLKFTFIEKDGDRIDFDEMMRIENPEDCDLLRAIEAFINEKVKKD